MVNLLLSLLMLSAKASAAERLFIPDLSLVGPASPQEPSAPFAASYVSGDRRLVFVTVRNGQSGEEPSSYSLIRSVFDWLSPGVSIVEGVPTVCLVCPPDCTAGLRFMIGSLEKETCDDLLLRMRRESSASSAFYAASLAYDAVPRRQFIGGEIANRDLKAGLLKKFPVQKVAEYFIARGLARQRQGGLS